MFSTTFLNLNKQRTKSDSFFLNDGLCSHVTERVLNRLKNWTKHFVHMEPLTFSLSQFSQILSNLQLGLDFGDH